MTSHLSILLQLRQLVGFLGERAQADWWPTAFYEASARPFLDPVFSKTSRLAQYHGVLEAARLVHDEHLNVGSYHLFRLPEEIEQDLHSMVQGSSEGEFTKQIASNEEAALDSMKLLAGSAGAQGPGPILVGDIENLALSDTLEAIASVYFSAFRDGQRGYPYLTGQT